MIGERESKRNRIIRRRKALDQDRSTWVPHWREVSDYMIPGAMRLVDEDLRRGEKNRSLILDNEAGFSINVMAAGLMAGTSSPARPWFRVTTADPDLADFHSVKEWNHIVTTRLLFMFAKSNAYRAIPLAHKIRGTLGTSCDLILDDFEDTVRFYPQLPGRFYLAMNDRMVVDTVYLDKRLTVEQMVAQYGLNKVSDTVRQQYNRGDYHIVHKIVHAIEPRDKAHRDLRKRDNLNMPWASVHIELNGNDKEHVLRESGFMEFPAVCPRWESFPEDTYGRSPGMAALADIKGLQFCTERKDKAIDYGSDPPIQIPTSMKNTSDVLPGGSSYYDGANPQGGIRTAFEVPLRLDWVLEDIRDARNIIQRHLYVDLFLMLSSDTRRQQTAREVAEKHEEKLLMLGPAMEQLHNECFDPMIQRVFSQGIRAGIFPPPPKELQDEELKIDYVSVLAQAQKMVGLGSVDRLLGTVGTMAGVWGRGPLHKINTDNVVDAYADMLGVNPEFIVANEQVAIIRKKEEQQQQAMIQAEAMKSGAETAKTISEIDTEGNNALAEATSQFAQV